MTVPKDGGEAGALARVCVATAGDVPLTAWAGASPLGEATLVPPSDSSWGTATWYLRPAQVPNR